MIDGKKPKTPRFFKITTSGKWFIFVTIALGIAAVNTGNNLVYLCLAMNLSLIITSGILSDLVTRKVSLHISPGKDIFAGKMSKILVTAKNEKKILPLFFLRIILEPAGKSLEGVIPYAGPGRETTAIIEGTFTKRGIYRIRKVSVMTRFPFGFFEKYYHVKSDISIIVFPFPEPISPAFEATLRHPNETDRSRQLLRTGSTGHSLNTIRKFLPKDPVKMVLWKKFMYTKQLYVKELEEEEDYPAFIEVHPDEDEAMFERQLMRCCGKIVETRKNNIPFVMKLEDGQLFSSDYPDPYQIALGLTSVLEKDGMGREKINSILAIMRR
jgi:uncharacterized protein (DUF58 family)